VTATLDASLLRDLVPDGATVAIGGAGLNRKPMSLVRTLVDAGTRDLVVVAFLGSVDVELLLAAGAVAELHTAGVSLDGFGLAPAYRSARQRATPRVVEWSEGTLVAALEAASRGVPSMPTTTSPNSEVVAVNPWLAVHPDPFTGDPVVLARALRLDVALIHAPAADTANNLYIDGDAAVDALIARAAGRTVATAGALGRRPESEAAISRLWVDQVFIDEAGSLPTGCHPGTYTDLGTIGAWAGSDGSDASLLMGAAS
jgi:glutaconate CoA-transferase subunit A